VRESPETLYTTVIHVAELNKKWAKLPKWADFK
jgi:hypothetical protein